MKTMIALFIAVSVFAAPCVIDLSSNEPSAFAGLLAVSQFAF